MNQETYETASHLLQDPGAYDKDTRAEYKAFFSDVQEAVGGGEWALVVYGELEEGHRRRTINAVLVALQDAGLLQKWTKVKGEVFYEPIGAWDTGSENVLPLFNHASVAQEVKELERFDETLVGYKGPFSLNPGTWSPGLNFQA